MNEKEFLIKFINDFKNSNLYATDESFIDYFLEEHHKEYYEVEFIEKEKSEALPDDYPVLDANEMFR